MKFDQIDDGGLNYVPCRYGVSRMSFRSPARDLTQPYMAFISGTEVFGRIIARLVPLLTEKQPGSSCVNLGCMDAGVDIVVKDPTIMAACHDAQVTVVLIMGGHTLSDRSYSVHPRRNDRFLSASTVLRAISDDVDFSEFIFTRHMLGALYSKCPERVDIVLCELREAWVGRMRQMLGHIGPNVVFLWLPRETLSNAEWSMRIDPILAEPLFVTKDMVEQLRKSVRDIVVPPFDAAGTTAGCGFPAYRHGRRQIC